MENSLSSASITDNLGTRLVGQRIIYYPIVTSTMEIARQEAQQGAPEGTVIIADEQTAGRGRIKRVWLSPRGSIALSIILYPDVDSLPFLIMLASLAVARSIETVTGLKPQLKWPNDVFVNGKKVCGILIESEVQGDKVNYAILGIGINVNLSPADFPEIPPDATSLSEETGYEISRLDIIRQLLLETDRLYLALPDGEAHRDHVGAVVDRVDDRVVEDRAVGTEVAHAAGHRAAARRCAGGRNVRPDPRARAARRRVRRARPRPRPRALARHGPQARGSGPRRRDSSGARRRRPRGAAPRGL